MTVIVKITVRIVNTVSITVAVANTLAGVSLPNLTCQQLNDGMSQTQRDELQRVIPVKTGQTVIFDPFDDGVTQFGRGVDFFTLDCNNSFGNTLRFTDTAGGQIFGAGNGSIVNYMIDHLTKLGWRRTLVGAANFSTQLANADASSFGGFNDWRVCNIKEYITLTNYVSANVFNWAPLNLAGIANQRLWTSTTRPSVNGITIRTQDVFVERIAKATNLQALICRSHF